MKLITIICMLTLPLFSVAQQSPIQFRESKSGLPENVLYIIDGVIQEKLDIKKDTLNAIIAINSIEPSDIESITILKDKSATEAYGDAGRNGVILFETKEYAKKIKKK